MNKHKPPKGEIASWKKHVEGYEKPSRRWRRP